MNKRQQIEYTLEMLSMAKDRGKLFFDKDIPPVVNFLNGIRVSIDDKKLYDQFLEAYAEIRLQHGYKMDTGHIYHQLKNLSDEEQQDIIISLEIEAWKLLLKATEETYKE